MSKSPYPQNCKRPNDRKAFLEEKAMEMAESGNFENARTIRQRLKGLGFGTLVDEVIPDVPEGFNFTYRLDDICQKRLRRDQHV